jgi:hypothetical protein
MFSFAAYPAADVDDPDAVLSVRDWPDGPRQVIERSRWRFARDDGSGRPAADDTHVWMEGGFEADRFYEVVYRTRACPVVGTGLLAVRDFVSHLRHTGTSVGNPCGPAVDHTIAYGASQSARLLRQLLFEGANVDELGRRVFDGVLAHIGGGRRGEFNHRFAQPSVTSTAGFGHLPPFATDDDGSPAGGLYDRQRAIGGVPRTIFTNSSWEYWRGDAALSHLGVDGSRDLPEADDTRLYLLSAIDHIGDIPYIKDAVPVANTPNPLDASLLLRAAFVNLERWVCDDVAPPPSIVPRLSDCSAVRRAAVLRRFEAIPKAELPDPGVLHTARTLDLGPDADVGIGRWPVRLGEAYPDLVSEVDDDGNEIAGVRLPELAVPLGTHTAWNPQRTQGDRPAVMCEFVGSFFPFAATAAEREETGDPRLSVQERYGDREDYLARVRAAADALVAANLMLAEDVGTEVARAARRWSDVVPESRRPVG